MELGARDAADFDNEDSEWQTGILEGNRGGILPAVTRLSPLQVAFKAGEAGYGWDIVEKVERLSVFCVLSNLFQRRRNMEH